MIIKLEYRDRSCWCDLSEPTDLSIPVGQVKCFYATDFRKRPYQSGDFIGAVRAGAPVNFFDVEINPHGNGTHTECLGHITLQQESINDTLKQFHFIANVISIPLEKNDDGDHIITAANLKAACPEHLEEALIIRTLPNSKDKLSEDYSGTNPPYIHKEAMEFIVKKGIKHLLLDLPSVDKEVDQGKLESHHIFWNVESNEATANSRKDCTITELIFVPDDVEDGIYLLNIQIPSLELDAAPSKPIIYKIHEDR